MVNVLLLLSLAISFFLTFFTLPFWIRKAKGVGLVWEDMNKPGHPKNVAGSGGIVVVIAFVIGILYYVAVRTFIFEDINSVSLEIFSLLSVVLILAIVGIIDDMFGWRNKGLSRRSRIFLAFVASVPLVVINAGSSMVNVPFFGNMDLGILYPLVLIPIGIAGATTTYNFLAGFNGLEAGQGILILGFLSYVAYITGSAWLALIGLIMVASLVGFLYYNKYPAKVFPGDSLTWSIGALIAGMAILGSFEKIAIFIFTPYIIETVLKSRGKLVKHSFAKPNKDGSLEMPFKKIYGLEHAAIYVLKRLKPSKKVYERDVVYLIHGFQIFMIILAFFIFL
ncbi:MAG TPA: glycosyl transferase family 4 [Candidatus Nanoarchaeia archaeon]|uniref:Glycosyl transferase family protein, UDP-N-acetylglucosamine--dolichyl-phosphate N-acetylglucosaminephosphotransferase n=1 Tax=uncultured archaeon Rifle_16ft_4_minimus_37913 TaxID=1665152 RepID=A0A0H4T6B3_9ARCH|nr:glycosyl transferase family protein, UDP-N-acetylglucosamine--dolichyl-phosphate N-acetylglucosaminephosphotransferase [uncultured archaeon Rifle_16ft_4_minimus_37913]HKZ33982.1 glycosyl transferase family 4 [Candidatus Nanoarchaeia archaeon]